MHRSEHWKLGFVGSRCTACGAGQLPPQRVCSACGAVDQMAEEPFANRPCKIATYTLDHLAYSLQPPTVAAVLDFEGGGRLACELTDVEPDEGRDRRRARDDVPPALHGPGRPQLLLEGAPARASEEIAMASNGIKDRVAIVGMGCTPFGEHWDKGADDLLVDAAGEAYRSAGVDPDAGRRLLARHDGQRHVGPRALRGAQAPLQAGHAAREHVRDRQRGDAQRRLRGGERAPTTS